MSFGCAGDPEAADGCQPDDFDGVNGGSYAFVLVVDDTAFAPAILKTQNVSSVRLTLTNRGSSRHGFSIECLPTPNADGCPLEACFSAESTIEALLPGESATVDFETPNPEGIYAFRSPIAGDVQRGQFVIQ